MTDWIREGHFERYIKRMRHFYDLRRQTLIRAFQQYFGSRVTILGDNAGIHVMTKIVTVLLDNTIIQQSAAAGIGLISAIIYYLQPQNQGEFIFGYAQLKEVQIIQGIMKLSQIIPEYITKKLIILPKSLLKSCEV